MNLRYLLDIAIGAGAGVGAFFFCKRKYDEQCQAKIKEVDDYYKAKLNELREREKAPKKGVEDEEYNHQVRRYKSSERTASNRQSGSESPTEAAGEVKSTPSYDYTAFARRIQEGLQKAHEQDVASGTEELSEEERAEREHPMDEEEEDGEGFLSTPEERAERFTDDPEEAMVDSDISDYIDSSFDGLNLGEGIFIVEQGLIDEVEMGDFQCQDIFYYTKDDLLIDSDDHPLEVEDTIGYTLTMNLGPEFMVYNANLDIAYHVRIIQGSFNGVMHQEDEEMEQLRIKWARKRELERMKAEREGTDDGG